MGLRLLLCAGLLAAVLTGVGAGCGGGISPGEERARTAQASAAAARDRREAGMRAVVDKWSRRLNAGDNRGIARLFKVPVVVTQGPYAFRLLNAEQVALWHRGLPCSGTIESVTIEGSVATVVLVLGDRLTSKCDAPGGRVAARFEIVGGRIVSWEQVPVPPEVGVAPSA